MTIFENWYVVSQGNRSLLRDRATSFDDVLSLRNFSR